MKLVEPAALKAPSMMLKEYIDTLGYIISKWRTPIIRVRNDGVLEEDATVFNALAEFGVRYVPVSDTPGEAGEVSLNLLDPFHEVQGNGLRVYDSVVELVSRDTPTPLVKLRSLSNSNVRVWAKLEWYHPFSLSIKDRVAWYMLHRFLERGIRPAKLYEGFGFHRA